MILQIITTSKDQCLIIFCPTPKHEIRYGGFNGGDPRMFFPDDCTKLEFDAHKATCRIGGIIDNPNYFFPNGHMFKTPFGLGIQVTEIETYFETL